jgi:lipoprotein NlpD
VVYAGGDLVGYGNLLIIKHDEHYLSAYGHNSKLVVKEGELVKVGQKIAEFGDTGADRVKLHFEIRRDGKPVNPLNLLSRGK